MRRKDREISNPNRINDIISKCDCCRLGFNDNGEVYIVPLNFGYTAQEEARTFYFHSAADGRKIDLIRQNNIVGFELDTNFQILTGETACQYSASFASVIGTGTLSIIEDRSQKAAALQHIMLHYTTKQNWDFTDRMIDSVCIFQMAVTSISCKEHL